MYLSFVYNGLCTFFEAYSFSLDHSMKTHIPAWPSQAIHTNSRNWCVPLTKCNYLLNKVCAPLQSHKLEAVTIIIVYSVTMEHNPTPLIAVTEERNVCLIMRIRSALFIAETSEFRKANKITSLT